MVADVTTTLVQLIESSASPSQTAGLAASDAALGSSGEVLSGVANWMQVLGSLEGPAAQAAVAKELGDIARTQTALGTASAAAEGAEASALATASASGFGAFLMLGVSIILTAVAAGQGDSSGQSQVLLAIKNGFDELANEIGSTWWPDNMTALNAYWAPPTGGVGLDLDDLARQGTAGEYVKKDVPNWHTHAQAFLNALTSDLNSANYWQAPREPAGDVPQAVIKPNASWWDADPKDFQTLSWYGHFPARSQVHGSPGGNVADPTTALPLLALALQSYLALHSLANLVDPSQPTLDKLLSQYGPDFTGPTGYLRVLYTQYSLAVQGIVKTDLPTHDEILGFLWTLSFWGGAQASLEPDGDPVASWGAPERRSGDPNKAFSGDGFLWQGRYGAAATYPQYGYYGRASFTSQGWPSIPLGGAKSVLTPAYLVSIPDTTNAVEEWWRASILLDGNPPYVDTEKLDAWVIPWLENKVILGTMARWKAIYLVNRYDRIWSLLRSLELLLKPDPPIVPAHLELDDGTRADGHWSLRELLGAIRVGPLLLTGISEIDRESATWLAKILYNIAHGNWGGPPNYGGAGEGPMGPFSLRDLLASVAS